MYTLILYCTLLYLFSALTTELNILQSARPVITLTNGSDVGAEGIYGGFAFHIALSACAHISRSLFSFRAEHLLMFEEEMLFVKLS